LCICIQAQPLVCFPVHTLSITPTVCDSRIAVKSGKAGYLTPTWTTQDFASLLSTTCRIDRRPKNGGFDSAAGRLPGRRGGRRAVCAAARRQHWTPHCTWESRLGMLCSKPCWTGQLCRNVLFEFSAVLLFGCRLGKAEFLLACQTKDRRSEPEPRCIGAACDRTAQTAQLPTDRPCSRGTTSTNRTEQGPPYVIMRLMN
jgi:hypothetical protein